MRSSKNAGFLGGSDGIIHAILIRGIWQWRLLIADLRFQIVDC